MDDRTVAAFRERVDVNPLTGCWVWRGYINPKTRYGTWTTWENGKAKTYYVHRLMYELEVEPIPAKMVLDHLCWNRACCNPGHLEPITQAENIRRGAAAKFQDGAAFQRNKTHCPQGHPYDDENTYVKADKSRHCRACAREKHKVWAAKNREENPKPPRERKQACVNGHALTDDNVINYANGKRSCRTCKKEDVKRYRERKAAEPG